MLKGSFIIYLFGGGGGRLRSKFSFDLNFLSMAFLWDHKFIFFIKTKIQAKKFFFARPKTRRDFSVPVLEKRMKYNFWPWYKALGVDM